MTYKKRKWHDRANRTRANWNRAGVVATLF